MKKTMTLLFTVLCCTSLWAQFEWTGPGQGVTKYVHTQNKGHIILRDSFFTAMDSTGGYEFEFPYTDERDSVFTLDVFELYDSTYIFFFEALTAIGPFYHGSRYDNSWEYPELNVVSCGSVCLPSTRGVPFNDNSYLVYYKGDNFVVRYPNNGGQPIWYKILGSLAISDLTVIGNQIFVCTDLGLYVLDENGEIIDQYEDKIFDRITPINDTSLLVQKADTLIRISTAFDLFDTLVITDGHFQDFDARYGKAGVLTTTGKYFVFDGELNEMGNFQLGDPALAHTHTQMGPSSVFLAGDYSLGQTPYQNEGVFVKEYAFDGTDNAPQKDAGVVVVTHNQQVNVSLHGSLYKVTYDQVYIRVKNFGNTPINKLILNAGLMFPSNNEVFTSTQNHYFPFAPLAPDSIRIITWEDFSVFFQQNPTGNEFELCFWTSSPNNGLDIDASNDVGCADFFVATEEVMNTTSINVYPNPTQGHITLSSVTPFPPGAFWSLYDAFGKLAIKKDIPSGARLQNIDLPDLAPGIYFWQLSGKDGSMVKGKLVFVK